jgi:N-acetylglutamate synthase-like GNAT family acetyltransferase
MSSIKPVKIRAATEHDLEPIYQLSLQLGYQPSREKVLSGLLSIQKNPDYEVVVLEEESVVLGWMTLCIRHRIEDVSFLQVAAVVTEEKRRGSGFGKTLLAYAEEQARQKKLAFVGLYSNVIRNGAHGFYENAGYHRAKESYFFKKDIHA